MKIITKECAYVQKIDISYLINSDLKIPESIYLKTCHENIDRNNKYEFIKFNNPEEIKYFKKLNWIIDYNDIKNLTEEEIIKLCQNIVIKINKIADKFNNMNEKKKEKNKDLILQSELLNYKMHSLRDALWFKQGHINMSMPKTNDNKKHLNKKLLI